MATKVSLVPCSRRSLQRSAATLELSLEAWSLEVLSIDFSEGVMQNLDC